MDKKLVSELNNLIKEASDESSFSDEVLLSIILNTLGNKNIIKLKDYKEILDKNNIEFKDIININEEYQNIASNIIHKLELGELSSIAEDYLNTKQKEITGSYYTPKYIIEFMINDSLKNYIIENLNINEEIIDDLINNEVINCMENTKVESILDLLVNIKIIDIACGSGLFLINMFHKLFRLRLTLNEYLDITIDEFKTKKEIIENNIFGIDIQSFPLQVFISSLVMDLYKYEEFCFKNFIFNIYQENSILGDKAYKIQEIKSVVNQKGFDIVIGNPPYIGEKGNRKVFQEAKKYNFGANYYEGKMDYFYYFIYRGIELLHKKGILTFITTNYFVTADGAAKLREYLNKNVSFKTIVNFNECEIFKSAKGQHNMIFTIVKGKENNKEVDVKYFNNEKYTKDQIKTILMKSSSLRKEISRYKIKNQNEIYGNNGNIIVYSEKRYINIIKKISDEYDCCLGELCNINQGIVSGADKVTLNMLESKLNDSDFVKFHYNIGEGIFVLKEEEVSLKNLSRCKVIKPFYKNSDIGKYYTSLNAKRSILYLTDNNVDNHKYCDAIQNHLYKFKTILSMRRETSRGTRKWYSLQWYRENTIFEKPKIVVPHRALKNNFGYNEDSWYASADVYFITKKNDSVNLKLLLGLLNSKVVYFWLYNMGKRKGNYLELYSKPLTQIPLKINIPNNLEKKIIDIVEEILINSKINYDSNMIEHYQDRIDKYIYSIYNFSDVEVKLIEDLYKQTS